MNNTKLWTKDFVAYIISNFFIAMDFYLLMTTMAVYTTDRFDASLSGAGLAVSIFVIGSLFTRLLTGKYLEVIGRKKTLYIGMALFVITTFLYFTADSLEVLLLIRFLHGAAFGIANTSISTLVMGLIPDARRGEGTSYYTLSPTGATAIGPFLGIYIQQRSSFEMIFALCAIFSVLSFILILFVKIPKADISDEQLRSLKSSLKPEDFFEKNALSISIIIFILGIPYAGVITFINNYAIEIGLTDAASFFFLVYAVFIFISRPFTGKLLDLKGDNAIIYPSIIIYFLSMLILSRTADSFSFLISAVLLALGFGTMMSCGQAIAVKLSPKHRVGLATSTYFVLLDTGSGIGPYLLGLIVPLAGYRSMYLVLAVLTIITILIYYLIHGRKAGKMLKNL